jgi:hypothetical protein
LRCACATRRTCATSGRKPTSGTASGSLSCMSTAAAARLHPRPADRGVTGAHPLPQEADRASRRRGAAAVEGP